MLIGPYLLGGVPLVGLPDGLFPTGTAGFPVSPELYGLCAVAAIVLLFSVGLETDLSMLLRYSVAGGMVGLGGVVASLLFGAGITMLFSEWVFGRRLGFLAPPCLFLGAISTATSVGITARILTERRKLDSPEGVTILAGAVIDDVLGIITLAIVLAVVGASRRTGAIDWGHIGVVALKAVGIWIGATAAGLLAARRISLLLKLFRDRASIAILAFGLALVLSGLFEEAGLAMIIGAYVMGMSLSRTDVARVVREKLEPVYEFLVPMFFCVMGMLVNFRALGSKSVIVFGLLYAAVAVMAKVIGCALPAACFGFTGLGALRVGVGMIPRGEVALIVAGIGLAAGALTQDVFGVAILMTLATTLVAPPALVGLMRVRRPGTRRPVAAGEEKPIRFRFPSPETADMLMDEVVDVLESEGFFVHLLNHEQRLYQVRKDTTIIGVRRDGDTLVFEAEDRDVAFVRTIVLEVVADLERKIRALQAPIDREALGREVQETAAVAGKRMKLSDYLSPRLIEPSLRGRSKPEVIDELLDLLARNGCVRDVEDARRVVWEREQSMSTGLQRGIAIPHGRTDSVNVLVCAVGIKREGLDFESLDGRPSRIIVLTLSPRSSPGPHVQFMSEISQALTEEACDRILATTDAETIYRLLTARG
jgi:Kef-type K+ transport system membrane component KefB/mannitol/fructose-specific phosphotransferase system IIA component (Ntr-type)